MKNNKINVGLIGYGTVGSNVYLQLISKPEFNLKKIGIKDESEISNAPAELFTTNVNEILDDTSIQIVIEAIDDAEAAFEFGKKALSEGKILVSANKKMLANHITELQSIANKNATKLYYEASVAAAIPILQLIENYHHSDEITSIKGIVNGSCNYILHLMETEQLSFSESLKQAQIKGFAESDPTLDIEAWDATYKACLLAYNSFGYYIDPNEIHREGITKISLEDITQAKKEKKRIKLIAEINKLKNNEVKITVTPKKVSSNDSLFYIDAENNAISIKGKYGGTNLYKGAGAGGSPTAAAMLGDVYLALKNL